MEDPGYEQEAIEQERWDADMEQAEWQALVREHGHRLDRTRAAMKADDWAKAAEICDHGWSGLAPDGGQRVCYHCGSRIDDQYPPNTVEAGAFPGEVEWER